MEEQMKTILISIAAGSLLATLATAQTQHCTVTGLGTLGGARFAQPMALTTKAVWPELRTYPKSRVSGLREETTNLVVNLMGQLAQQTVWHFQKVVTICRHLDGHGLDRHTVASVDRVSP
jgi:hypothetical protein